MELQERTSLPSSNGKGSNGKGPGGKGPDFYANLGSAIRVIREDYPALFQKDLNCAPCSLLLCARAQRCSLPSA